MECPLCQSKKHVEVDLHADGYTEIAYECGDCGAVWTHVDGKLKVIKGKLELNQKVSTQFTCPTCHCIVNYETDLDAFQFHEELYECANCGTVCSVAHNQVEVVKDSQKGSFLDTTGDLVEADDYNTM
ncbi:MAG: hypothetical protein C0622_10930 [Desulfuromonas sp.]|nr:MAG: hypothetical protein C0622_10930 [Desulfuromonas sp.]